MKKSMMVFTLALAATAVFAEDAEEEQEEAAKETPAVAKPAAPAAFTALPFCRRATAPAEVKKVGSEGWAPIEEGRFYPLGSAYRTRPGGMLTLAFGPEANVTISNDASFVTRVQAIGDKCRAITALTGEVALALPDKLPEGAFTVALPGFTLKNPAGASKIRYEVLGDGDRATVRCVTGLLGIEGRHFAIPSMRAANEVVIRTSHDNLETILDGTSGDYIVKLDRGLAAKTVVGDDGAVSSTVEKGTLDFHLSPKTKVRVSRAVPAIGERMSVAVMTFDAAGEMRNNFAYAENRAEVNSGELVKASKADEEAIAKRAAEATETTEAADADDEKDDSEKEEKDDSEKE